MAILRNPFTERRLGIRRERLPGYSTDSQYSSTSQPAFSTRERSLLSQLPPSYRPTGDSRAVRELRSGSRDVDRALAGQAPYIQEGRDLTTRAINEGSDRTLGLLQSQKQELIDQTGNAITLQQGREQEVRELTDVQKAYQRQVAGENQLRRQEETGAQRDSMNLLLGGLFRTASSDLARHVGDFETKVARGAQLLDSQEMAQIQELDVRMQGTVREIGNTISQLQTGLQAAMRENDVEQTFESRNRVTQLKTAINQAQQQLQAVQVQRADAKMQMSQAIASQYTADEQIEIQKRASSLQERLAHAQLNGVDPVTGQVITAEQQRQFENQIKLAELVGEINGQQTLAGRTTSLNERTGVAGITGIDPTTGQRTIQGQLMDQDESQFSRSLGYNYASLAQDKSQFGMDYALRQRERALSEATNLTDGMGYWDDNNNWVGPNMAEAFNISLESLRTGAGLDPQQYIKALLSVPDGTKIPTRLEETLNPNGGKECAEYVNDIIKTAGIGRMGDTFQSKLNVASQRQGSIGSAAVWQPYPDNPEWAQYGHTGIIIGEEGNNWIIKSSNLHGDGKITTDSVPKSSIKGYTVPASSTNPFSMQQSDSYAGPPRPFRAEEFARAQAEGYGLDYILSTMSPEDREYAQNYLMSR